MSRRAVSSSAYVTLSRPIDSSAQSELSSMSTVGSSSGRSDGKRTSRPSATADTSNRRHHVFTCSLERLVDQNSYPFAGQHARRREDVLAPPLHVRGRHW